MSTPVLFCCDPLNPSRVDPYFQQQSDVARALGAKVVLLDHDALVRGDIDRAVRRVPQDLGLCWYRGWMMPAARYAELEQALADRGTHLLTSAVQYQCAHELPGWYDTFSAVTPQSVWMTAALNTVIPIAAVAELGGQLGGGPAVVKDFVKSRKHEWDKACFVANVSDAALLHAVVSRLVELQGDDLAGGIVIRQFETFTAEVPDAGEARVWWLDGEPILTGPHPDAPDAAPSPELTAIRPLVQGLGCRFVTTDIARHTDGRWRVVEVGDGQVSDLPSTVPPELVLSRLVAAS